MPKTPPTILQIIPRLDAGGAELSAIEMTDAVVRAGGRMIVLAEPGRLAPKVAAAGGEVVPFPAESKNPARMLANARAIARIAAERRVALIHARSRAPAWSALIAARYAGIPFVTTYHGAYSETNAAKRFYNSVMARGDVVIANSHYTAGLIASRYGTPADRVVVVHRGVDVAAFDPEAIEQHRPVELRERWGVDPDDRVILQAARLTSWKGQHVLIDAAARLAERGQLASTVVVLAGDAQGRDGYVEGLRAQIAGYRLERCVRIIGHVDDMAAGYLAADATVIASTEPEAFGRTAIEAAAMGCPVIATAIGAPPETVLAEPETPKEAITGWLVPPNDPEALADRLAEALSLSLSERRDMGNRARRHAVAHFTVKAMQRRTLAVYDKLMSTGLEQRFAACAGP
ncbi:MAG TPA: glycosyltransferase family 4 protein [Hyphomicrobiaceae bacterium]|nr:glycosyltransferase family 4 protein [Hyphomicrobiaceae bacterium]